MVLVEVVGVLAGAVHGVLGGGAAGGSSTLAGTAVTVWYIGVPAFPFLESLFVFSLLEVVGGAGVVRLFSPGAGPRGVAPPPLDPATSTTPSLAWTVMIRGSLWRRRNNRIFSVSFSCVRGSGSPLLHHSFCGSFECMPRPVNILDRPVGEEKGGHTYRVKEDIYSNLKSKKLLSRN